SRSMSSRSSSAASCSVAQTRNAVRDAVRSCRSRSVSCVSLRAMCPSCYVALLCLLSPNPSLPTTLEQAQQPGYAGRSLLHLVEQPANCSPQGEEDGIDGDVLPDPASLRALPFAQQEFDSCAQFRRALADDLQEAPIPIFFASQFLAMGH